jgi:hypothetical protein
MFSSLPAIMPHEAIQSGRYYSNGAYGRAWGVRQVITCAPDPNTGEERVSFRGMAGSCRRKQGNASLTDFAAWARYEVSLNENSWQRVGGAAD